jgi:hypothetical protein
MQGPWGDREDESGRSSTTDGAYSEAREACYSTAYV